MSTYIIVFLCIVVIGMAAITAATLKKAEEYDERCMTFAKATENYWKEYSKVERELRDQKQDFWAEINKLELENKELKEIIEKYKKQLENNVPRETYNKSYGVPEVVDWINQNTNYSKEDK